MTGERRLVLEVKGLRVRRNGFTLEVPSLALAEGDILALIGPNGAGKTTLLMALCGLLKPAAGEIRFRGEAVDPASLRYRRRITMVFQEPLMLRGTVADNVEAGLKLRGLGRAELRERVEESLERFQIAPLAARSAQSLSGGEARRVSLARAFALEPEVLFLDEPLMALDPLIRKHIVRDLEGALSHSRLPAVFTTHERREALRLADRIAVLEAGRIVQEGTKEELARRPPNEFSESFFDDLGGPPPARC